VLRIWVRSLPFFLSFPLVAHDSSSSYPLRIQTTIEAADVILTVPAAWDAAGCALMREAALKAGMVQASRGGDRSWRDRLRIITFVSPLSSLSFSPYSSLVWLGLKETEQN
jgi:hypothetical protein